VEAQAAAKTTPAKTNTGLEAHGRKPVVRASRFAEGVLQRKCACGGAPGPSGECAECRKQHSGLLQRQANGPQPAAGVPAVVHEVLSSPGQPLDPATRAFMEPRFGHDFSRVRVHADNRAAESARAVNALAYAVGRDVVFDSGQYTPHSPTGRKLIAHELAHVVQQDGSVQSGRSVNPQMMFSIGSVSDPAEAAADQAAARVMAGRSATHTGSSAPVLRRQPRQPREILGLEEFDRMTEEGREHPEATPGTAPEATEAPSPESTTTEDESGDPCRRDRCETDQVSTIEADIPRAIDYVNRAITALSASPLSEDTIHALDWYFNDHSEETVNTVRTRFGCILECLQDTRDNARWGCDPHHSDVAYVAAGPPTICGHTLTNVCFTSRYFGRSERARTQTVIHECCHRVGMALRGSEQPDIYRYTSRFLFLDTEEALQNSDSYALFAGAIVEGVPLTILFPVIGVSGGFAAPATGSATWRASLYYGAEFQHPVLGMFNPSLGLGVSFIGETSTEEGTPITSPPTLLASLLLGVRIRDSRPGADGGGYISLFGGPSLAIGHSTGVGAEAGFGIGYRWRWLDVSAGVGYTYDPTRETGMNDLFSGNVSVTFMPIVLSEPGH